jgi:hypothetical protein
MQTRVPKRDTKRGFIEQLTRGIHPRHGKGHVLDANLEYCVYG